MLEPKSNKRKNSSKIKNRENIVPSSTTLAKKLASAIGEKSIEIKDLKNTKKRVNKTTASNASKGFTTVNAMNVFSGQSTAL